MSDLRQRVSELLAEPVYEDDDKAKGISITFLMRLNLLAYEAGVEGYGRDSPFVAESLIQLTDAETENCPVCHRTVLADTLLSYNNEPNAFCDACLGSKD